MNKKAQVGETMSWTVAFFIILFIMLLFNSFSISLAGRKTTGNKEVLTGNILTVSAVELSSFLNSFITYNNQNIKIIDLIQFDLNGEIDKGKYKEFESYSERFIKEFKDRRKKEGEIIEAEIKAYKISDVEEGISEMQAAALGGSASAAVDMVCDSQDSETLTYFLYNKKIRLCILKHDN